MKDIDHNALREAFSAYMTGVTVVTTINSQNQPIGFTANSFTSVSLDPPLLLVCLAKTSKKFREMTEAKGFAVNVLAESQKYISNTFASPVEERFQLWHGPRVPTAHRSLRMSRHGLTVQCITQSMQATTLS